MSRREAILRFIAGLFGGQVAAFALLAMFWSTEGIHPKDVMYSIILLACFGLFVGSLVGLFWGIAALREKPSNTQS